MATKKKTKRRVNKSEEIRRYKEANPSAMPKEIAEVLTKRGVKVSAAQVSTTLFYAKRRLESSGVIKSGGAVPVEELKIAAQLIKACGSVERAEAILSIAKSLTQALK